MLKSSNDSEPTKKPFKSRNANRNHSPFLKERDSNNSGNPSSINKNKNGQKLIMEKNPAKNIGLTIIFVLLKI